MNEYLKQDENKKIEWLKVCVSSSIIIANLIIKKLNWTEYSPVVSRQQIIDYYDAVKTYAEARALRENCIIKFIDPDFGLQAAIRVVENFPNYFTLLSDKNSNSDYCISITDDCDIQEFLKMFRHTLTHSLPTSVVEALCNC